MDLRRGERVQIKADGTIVTGRARFTPDGLRSSDPSAPLPRAAEGVLIGAISNDPNSPIIEIGLSREFVADRDGRLYLTANRGTYADARGAFNVQVRTERNFTRRPTNTAAGGRDDDDGFDAFGTGDRRDAPPRPRTATGERVSNDPFGGPNRTPREVTIDVPARRGEPTTESTCARTIR